MDSDTPDEPEFDAEEAEELAVPHADVAYQEFFVTFERLKDEGYSLFPILVGLQRCAIEVVDELDGDLHR